MFTKAALAHESSMAISSCSSGLPELSTWTQAIEYRSRYVQQYVQCLHDGKMGGDEATAEMDAQLNEHTILTFRKLAHAKASQPSPSCTDLS